MARIAVVLNASWNIWNFRLPLMRHLENAGHDVLALAPVDEYTGRIPFEFHPITLEARSLNPLAHVRAFRDLVRAFGLLRPDLALLYTVQPNVYGNFAAARTGVRTISTIAGRGSLLSGGGARAYAVGGLYRRALAHAGHVLFQNADDREAFLERRMVDPGRVGIVPGSGIDLERFRPPQPRFEPERPFAFLLACRMLPEKGIEDYCAAARRITAEHANTRFLMVGPAGDTCPGALAPSSLREMAERAGIEYRGSTDTIEDVIADCDCVVLPTHYGEGVPRILLEASAMGRPVVASDVPGCREAVDDGVSGFLCRPRDPGDLAGAMRRILAMDAESRRTMGQEGRRRVEQLFDQRAVFRAYDAAVRAVLGADQKYLRNPEATR